MKFGALSFRGRMVLFSYYLDTLDVPGTFNSIRSEDYDSDECMIFILQSNELKLAEVKDLREGDWAILRVVDNVPQFTVLR